MAKIELCNIEDKDIPLFKKWLNLPHVSKWYREPQDWIKEIEQRDRKFSFIHYFIVEAEGQKIGFCQFYEYCKSGEIWHGDIETEGTYSIDYLIGNVNFLKKGYGKATIKSLVAVIKTIKNAKRIIVQPESDNKASCSTLLSSGFCFDKTNELYILKL